MNLREVTFGSNPDRLYAWRNNQLEMRFRVNSGDDHYWTYALLPVTEEMLNWVLDLRAWPHEEDGRPCAVTLDGLVFRDPE